MTNRKMENALDYRSKATPAGALLLAVATVVLIVAGGSEALAACDPASGACAVPSFAAAQNHPSGGSVPAFVVAGDFDGNGYMDLVVTHGGGVLSLLRGNGDGSFQSATTIATGLGGRLAAADLDGDLDLDLAGGSNGGSTVTVLRNDGTGAFTPLGPFPAGPSAAVYSVKAADVNGDGDPDLLTANSNIPGTVSVLLGDGTGTVFSSPVNFLVGAGPLHVSVADFNADPFPDLAVANANSDNISILLGTGSSGIFGLPVNYTVGIDPRATDVGDFDCDGDLDLVVANGRADNAQVLLGNGNGTFQAAVVYPTGLSPVAVVVADFNGDGKSDFVTADPDSNRVSVLLGSGDGTFQPAVGFVTGSVPFDVAVADFNGCGPDVATPNRVSNNVSVLLNTCLTCDDNNPCTDDSCGSFCSLLTTKPCTTNADCTAGQGTCLPPVCIHTPVANGTACSDGNICTLGDVCIDGVCVAGPVVDCDDNNPCTDDYCDPALGCAHVVNSGPCDDGLFCTAGDHCDGGACVTTPRNCNDSVPCTLDSCDEAADRCVNDVTPCGPPGDVDFCAVPPTQMRAWWPLDETAGPTAREIMNGNTGTHTNGPTPVSGQVAGALQFDGVNDHVSVADSPTLNFGASTGNGGGDLSIDAWIKTTATGGIRTIVDKRTFGPTLGYTMFLLDGKLSFQLADAGGLGDLCGGAPTDPCRNFVSSTVVATGNWVHVAVTVDRDQSGGGHFWVNGAIVGTFDPTTKTGSLANTAPLYIARHADGSNVFPGAIDEVEIFGRELSQDDITRIYNASARGKCKCVNPPSDMVSWYPADDCLPGDHIGPNNGTWSGQPFCSSDAKVGNGDLAPFMSSPPTFVTVPSNASLNFGTGDFSVDLWIKTGASGPIIGKGMATGPGWLLSVNASGQLSFTACDTSQCFGAGSSNTSVNNNGWRLVGMTVSRGVGPNPPATITYYVDGHPDGSVGISSMTSMDSVESMLIGASPGSIAPYFSGEMDEIEIFKRALTDADMKAIHDADTYGKCKCLDPLPKNMLAWWPLDEPAGITSQDIIGGYTGTWTGSPVAVAGYVAGALDFGSSGNNYVSAPITANSPLNFGTGNFSVDAWVYWRGGAGDQPIVESVGGTNGWNFVFSQKFVHAHLGGGGASSLGAAPLNTWVHVALTVQQGTTNGIKFYKNGVLQGSANSAPVYDFGGPSTLNIGKRFNGKIDEVEIFNRVLGSDEILKLYRAGHDGKCKEQRPAPGGDIMIEKSIVSGTPVAGSYVTFRVIVSNNGPTTASNIIVNDLLPPGLVYVSSTLPPGWTYDPATGTIFAPSLPSLTSNLLSITAYLDTCNMVTNCATFRGADPADTNGANDTACVTIQATTPCGVISGTKYVDADKSGTRNGEPIVQNQNILLKTPSSGYLTDATDVAGLYSFQPLPAGSYAVTEQLNPGQVMIQPAAGKYPPNLGAGQTLGGNDFGNYLCPAPVTPTCYKISKGMVGWWPFDETSGQTAFDIIASHNAQHIGSPTHDPSGEVAHGLGNTSSVNYVRVNNGSPYNFKSTGSGASGFTIDAWVKRTQDAGELWIVDRGTNFRLAANTTSSPRPYFQYGSCHVDWNPGSVVLLNVWTHLAVTVEPSSSSPNYGLRGYLNGVLAATGSHCGYDLTTLGNTSLNMGGGTFPGPGGIDELEIFKRALTQAEIQAIVNAGPNGKCKQPKCELVKHKNYTFAGKSIVSPITICNRLGLPDTFHWSMAGLPVAAGCSFAGPTIFTPTAGSVVLNPGQCTTINVTVRRPDGMPSGQTTCYQATVVPHSATACFNCKSTAAVSTKVSGIAQNQYTPVERIPYDAAKSVTFIVGNLHGDTDVVSYQLDVSSADSTDPPNSLIRLNGLPPGTPVEGILNVPVGTTTTVAVSVSYDETDPLSFYDLVLSTDQVAFAPAAVEPLAAVGLMSVSPDAPPDPCDTALPSSDIVLRWNSHTLLTWTGGTCGSVFNVYRGTTARLTGSDYGSCFDSQLTESESLDPSFPPVGSFDFYLVTGSNGQGEGTLGTNHVGAVRPNFNPCP